MPGLNLVIVKDAIKHLAKIRGLDSTDTDAYYTDVIFSNDGTKMLAAVNDRHTKNGKIHEYNCSNFDSNTATYVRKIDLNATNFQPAGGSSTSASITKIGFNNDGSKLFAIVAYRITRTSSGGSADGGIGWSDDVKYVESYLHEVTLDTNFSLASLSSPEIRGLYGNRWDNPTNVGDEAEGPTLLGFVDANTANENTYRIPTGFEFQEDGKKLFITSIRGHVAAAENEVTSDNTYFGDVCVLPLTTAYDITTLADQTTNTGFNSANNMIVRRNIATAAKDAGVAPFDIVLHDGGKTMSILCLDTTTFNGIVYHYNLSTANDISTATFVSFTNIKDFLPTSLHVNNFSKYGERLNLSVVGGLKRFFQPFRDNTNEIATIGNSSTIESSNPFSIYQFKKPKDKSRQNNYFKYDPTQSKILTTNGDVFISELKVNESKIQAGGSELTFVGLVSQDVNGETYYAIIVNPSAVVPLQVQLVGGDTRDIIQTQPYLSDANVQGILTEQNGPDFLQNLN